MSKVGEATGGFGRFFGGIARRDLFGDHFDPVTFTDGTMGVPNNIPTALINAPGEGAWIVIRVPNNFRRVRRLVFFFMGQANAHIAVQYQIFFAGCNEVLQTAGFDTVHITTVTNEICCLEAGAVFWELVAAGDIVVGLIQGIAANGDAIATNVQVIGAAVFDTL